MARNVRAGDTWYVVNIDKNREDPEPLKVLLSPLLGRDILEYEANVAKPGAGKKDMYREVMAMHHQMLADRIKDIQNYRVGDKDIRTGADLLEFGEKDVIDDVFRALTNLSYLTEGELKN